MGVSRAHLELMITKEGCTIKDLGSRNGTKLDGEEIAPYKEYPLAVGDTFTIAEQDYTLRMN
ncbi:FHA domain protein [compost metagenome]